MDDDQEVAFLVSRLDPKINSSADQVTVQIHRAEVQFMAHICEGSGRLTPTGKRYPETGVRVSISHEELVQDLPNGVKFKLKKAVVHSVTPHNGETLLPADYDLVMNGEILRLKKLADNSQWLVLSSPTA